MNKSILVLLAILLGFHSQAQDNNDKVVYEKALLIAPSLGLLIPGADLADRFGVGYQFGLNLDYRLGKNWYVGGEGGFIFGTKVKETSHLQNAVTSNGFSIASDGVLDEVNLNLRGAVVKFNGGKSFFFKPEKPGNGVLIKLGIGYLQHKILIDVDKEINPQLSGNYAKGYDRFSSGLVLSQYVGLMRLDRGKYVNVALGFEISEAFTSDRRPYDFGTQQKISGGRLDLTYGIKFTWMIPVYIGESSDNQYYTY